MDYGLLPPEINSGRMYSGAGVTPLVAAASAWNNLAAELSSTASSYETVISTLTGEEWLGPASTSMAAAATPYLAWLNTTAAQAQQTATQAQSAAAAYEAAFAMTVPPPVIAANRAQLAALVATNVLGQNTPAIMATEAHYGEMWAQDAAAMYGYAGSSAAAAKLTPFTPAQQTTNQTGIVGQAAAVTQAAGRAAGSHAQVAQLISTVPSALQSLASPLQSASSTSSTSGLSGAVNSLLGTNGVLGSSFSQNFLNGVVNVSSWNIAASGSDAFNLLALGFSHAEPLPTSHIGSLFAPGGPLATLGSLGGGLSASAMSAHTSVAAGMGQASMVGGLSVPAGWSAATPAGTGSATLAGTGWAAAPESAPMATVPAGMPAMASSARGGVGFGAPRYGFKPTVMPRSVVG